MDNFRFFAEVIDGVVTRVLTVHSNEMLNDDGVEQESLGQAFLNNLFGESNWVLCSNDGFRKQFPILGSTFNSVENIFIGPQPYGSWTLDSNFDWQPPTPRPTELDGYFVWNESTLSWER
jgi:hypothetical protein